MGLELIDRVLAFLSAHSLTCSFHLHFCGEKKNKTFGAAVKWRVHITHKSNTNRTSKDKKMSNGESNFTVFPEFSSNIDLLPSNFSGLVSI